MSPFAPWDSLPSNALTLSRRACPSLLLSSDRLASVGQTTAFTASALYKGSSKKYLADLSDFVALSIVPGAVATRSMHDAQRLDTELAGTALEVKLPGDQDYSTVLILGPYARMHAMVVRKDIPVCGGGYVQVTDGVILPHPM